MNLHNIVSSIFLCIFIFNKVLSGSKVGVYIDNGLDQTTNKDLSKTEKMELELAILDVLGLPEKPRNLKKSVKRSTLEYLLTVYEFLSTEIHEEHGRSRRSVDLLNVEKQNAIEESDMIMTFDGIVDPELNIHYEKGKRLYFNLSELPIAEDIVGAELRIFQKGASNAWKKSKRYFDLEVYEVINLRQIEMQYVSSVNTSGSYNGWLSIDITSCVLSWLAFPSSWKSLYLALYASSNQEREIRHETIGLSTDIENEETHPFIVVYLKNVRQVRPKRLPRDAKPKPLKKSESMEYARIMQSYHDVWTSSCKIHTLYISFKDLQWQDWIIAPQGYSAHYCAGECKFPLTASMNATGHALVQSWAHHMYPHKYPRPSCVPTELMPMYLIYQQEDTAAIQKKKNMVVKSCGCH